MENTTQKTDTKETILRLLALVALLWLFLVSINGLSASIKGFGSGADKILTSVNNPIIGLMMGMLVTCLLQSSSTTTSLIVGMVASGQLSVAAAVPMVMGANIGTTITNTLVSMGSITRSSEFKRSFAAANIHDVFNILSVAILLPLEVFFGLVSRSAVWFEKHLTFGATKPNSPIKDHFKGVVHFVQDTLDAGFGSFGNWALLIFSVGFTVMALYLIVRTMKGVILARAEVFFDKIIGKSPLYGMAFGVVVTAMVQSSSITTSLMVPLAGVGAVSLATIFPITLGCNIGTTITAMLAAIATGNPAAIDVALCHLIFNIYGILIVYCVPPIRNFVLKIVEWLSHNCTERKYFAPLYVVIVFFGIPLTILGIQNLVGG